MSGKHKLRELFLMGRDGLKKILEPSKRYIMSRQGDVIEVAQTGSSDESDTTFAAQVSNPNSLVVSGERGDLRQLETMIRNMTSIYSNAVMNSDLYHSTGGGEATEQTLSTSGALNLFGLRRLNYLTVVVLGHKGSDSDGFSIEIEGSLDNSTWEHVTTLEYTATAEREQTIFTKVIETPTPYRFLRRKSAYASDIPMSLVINHSPPEVERFLSSDEGGRINELVGESYDLSVFVEGGMPPDGEIVTFKAPQRLTLKANFEDCVGKCIAPPRSAFGLEVYKNTSKIGIITLHPSGVPTATYPATVFNEGDRLTIKTSTIADSQLSDVALTLVFTRG